VRERIIAAESIRSYSSLSPQTWKILTTSIGTAGDPCLCPLKGRDDRPGGDLHDWFDAELEIVSHALQTCPQHCLDHGLTQSFPHRGAHCGVGEEPLEPGSGKG
jgi:hypothetical protein